MKHQTIQTLRCHRSTRLLLGMVVLLLLCPAGTSVLIDESRLLQSLENRKMQTCPSLSEFSKDPKHFIKQTELCIKDHIGFRRLANAAYRRMRLYLFHDPPLANITIGKKGHVFMNSHRIDRPRLILKNLCETQLHPQPELVRDMDTLFTAITTYYQQQGCRVTIAAAPTTYSLYADYLPLRLDKSLRQACQAYPTSDSLLLQLVQRSTQTQKYDLYYPLEAFRARRADPLFYPQSRFHWSGTSAFLFARSLLQHSGAVKELQLAGRAEVKAVDDDLNMFFGFSRRLQARWYPYHEFTTIRDVPPWAPKLSKNGGLHRYRTQGALSSHRGLLIANSFGIELSKHLAKGFSTFYFYDLNHIQKKEEPVLFRTIAKRTQADFVYFVLDDAGIVSALERLGTIRHLLAGAGTAHASHPRSQSSKP